MNRHLPLFAALALTGCEDTLSSAPFVSDAEFLAALPTVARHTLDVVDTSDGSLGVDPPDSSGWPDLLQLSKDVGGDLNGLTLGCLRFVEATVTTTPTYRSESAREWGPFEGDDAVTYNVEMTRRTGTYGWSLRAAPTGDSDDLPLVCAGEHLGGPTNLSDGSGTLDIWLEEWFALEGSVGTLAIDYDLTAGQEFRIDIDGLGGPDERPEDGRYYFRRSPQSGGDFHYKTTILLEDQYEAILEVRTRWNAEGAGRADARVFLRDVRRTYRFFQCFTPGERYAWRWTDFQSGFEDGDPSKCVFDEPATVDQI